MSPTPLTDAVDAASYADPHAHREALRKLCRELEQKLSGARERAHIDKGVHPEDAYVKQGRPNLPWA